MHLAVAEGTASPLPTSNDARFAWTPTLGTWDLGIGAQTWYGTARVDDGNDRGRIRFLGTRAWALDDQAMGKVGRFPLSLYGSVARAAGSGETSDTPNLFNEGPRDRSAFALSTEPGVVPDRGSVLLAYRNGDNGMPTRHQDRSVTMGGMYHLHQNVQVQVNWSLRSGDAFTPRPKDGNRLLTVMRAAAM